MLYTAIGTHSPTSQSKYGADHTDMVVFKSHDAASIGADNIGDRVTLGGWIEDMRPMGKMVFATIRDASGRCQIIARGQTADILSDITRQSAASVVGKVQGTRSRDFEVEILAESITLHNRAVHPLPVDPAGRLESGMDVRLNHRALDMRNPRTAAIFRIRHVALQAARKALASDYTEITTPKIIGSASEGGANLFSLEYFGRTAYLAQSPQLYKEQMTLGLERVFEVSSFYRAEKSHTGRHLTEFTSVDIEAAFMDYTDVMDKLQDMVVYMFEAVSKECVNEQKVLGHDIIVPSAPFKVIPYEQALSELADTGISLEFGDDLQDAHLRTLGEMHPEFYFLTDWPIKLKPFYIMPKDGGLSRSFDLQYGYLELSSGGMRLHEPDTIRARLTQQGLDPAQFEDHLKTFEWGMPPHSGWGLGLDRLVAVLAGVDNVRETVLYPRDPDRLLP